MPRLVTEARHLLPVAIDLRIYELEMCLGHNKGLHPTEEY